MKIVNRNIELVPGLESLQDDVEFNVKQERRNVVF